MWIDPRFETKLAKVNDLLILSYLPFFSVGMLAYQLAVKREIKKYSWWLVLGISLVLIKHGLGWSSFSLQILFAVLVFTMALGFSGPLKWKPLVFLGTISYPIYLLHQAIGYIFIQGLGSMGFSPYSSIAIVLLLIGLISWLLHIRVEIPMQQFLRSKGLRHGNNISVSRSLG